MGIKGKPIFERKLKDMKVGEKGYIVPWALDFDENETPYLNLGMNIKESPSGTCSLPIERTGPGKADYRVNLDFDYFGKKYKWTLSECPFAGVVGVNKSEIVRLDYNPKNTDREIPELSKEGTSKLERAVTSIFQATQKKYPLTHEIRLQLRLALLNEEYELAAKLRDKINSTKEPL